MRPDTCIHFTGILKKCCERGVGYKQFSGEGQFGWGRLPCVGQKDSAVAPLPCEKRQLPTPTQVEEHQAKQRAAAARVLSVMPAVNEWRNEGKLGKYEVIECPACKGKLRLHQSARNGHVHGHCETDGCVQWME